ncbi:MAG: ATPase-like, ParA/MinD [Candidatus Gottesmanbacteria bacterium GW2011_GWB1_49_7]|uniref:ATPase-like, ParA/MinD n=1 Tax=Candidatus Gottesmanbacteria bacterium GW2011_GWB1_49_7 TaxID=1618448 RepID=A0A0G1YZD5_9BACT|nr:MAG: ATPase-like, ParA/MinD [Candidatus Gottesmanbacteria bacterium GW2011_GWB1_49_7]
MSGKGGVSKSTTSALLALELSKTNTVAVVDCDLTAPNLARVFGVKGKALAFNAERRLMAATVNKNMSVFSSELMWKDDVGISWTGQTEKDFLVAVLNGDVDFNLGKKIDVIIMDMAPSAVTPLAVAGSLFKSRVGGILVSVPRGVSLDNNMRCVSLAVQHEIPLLGIIAGQTQSECPECGAHPVTCSKCHMPFIPYGEPSSVRALAEKVRIPYLGEIYFNPRIGDAMDAGAVETMAGYANGAIAGIAAMVRTRWGLK